MKGDFSRDTFDQARHFSRVLMQQGRVQLDADWNEQTSILLHYMQTLAADLIGPHAGPAGALGFDIQLTDDSKDLRIGAGRYYVDGILCENEQECWYSKQPDYPLPDNHSLDLDSLIKDPVKYGVYLDVWERHITFLDDDRIREVALGGPDTATRAKVVWQVKIVPLSQNAECDAMSWGLPTSDGCMQARVNPGKPNTDPCITAPDAKYRGPENQLYRVEMHEVKTTTTHNGNNITGWFKWSRDNGSVMATVVKARGKELTIYPARGFAADQWVEMIDDGQELRGEPGKIARVVKVEGDILTVDYKDVGSPIKVRAWDGYDSVDVTPTDESVAEEKKSWIDLEHGIQIYFEPGRIYCPGDYWLIPARVATGKIEWPLDMDGQPEMLPARGIEHHYAPLAILTWKDNAFQEPVEPCRCKIDRISICPDEM